MKNLKKISVRLIATLFLVSSQMSFAYNTTGAIKACKTELSNMHGEASEADNLLTVNFHMERLHDILDNKTQFLIQHCSPGHIYRARCEAMPTGITEGSPEYIKVLNLFADVFYSNAPTNGSQRESYLMSCLARNTAKIK